MAKLVFAGFVVGATAENGRKGFRHMYTNSEIGTATITDDMRKNAPSKLDWSENGGTTAVKDQGDCGSCWAYSTVEGVESGLFMSTGQIVELSPQQIISCDKTDGGCDGGDVDTGMEWVDRNGGLTTNAKYPETSSASAKDGKCKHKANVVKVTDYKWAIPSCTSNSCAGQNESDLMAALHNFGPLSICVAADWDHYKHGVLSTKCSHKYNDADHCVQLVGYDSSASTPYWKVRNSWSSSWGENGHIRLPMGVNSCGLANWPMMVKAEMITMNVTEEVTV